MTTSISVHPVLLVPGPLPLPCGAVVGHVVRIAQGGRQWITHLRLPRGQAYRPRLFQVDDLDGYFLCAL